MSRRTTTRPVRKPDRSAFRLGALAASATIGVLIAVPTAQAGPMPGAGKHRPAVCRRVPAIDTRLGKAIERLDGDAGVRGSIAHLQQRIAQADRRKRPAVTTRLDDRLTTRQRLVSELRQRRADLATVRTWCDARPSSPVVGPRGSTNSPAR
jgi:hypothetical protein